MTLVAHRGAPKRIAENTLAAITAAYQAGYTVVEYDVRLAADGKLVLHHDDNLQRVCGDPRSIAKLSSTAFSALSTKDGVPLSTLVDVLSQAPKGLKHIIELKEPKTAKSLALELKEFRSVDPIITSFNWDNVLPLASAGLVVFAATKWRPMKALKLPAHGVTVRWWMMNPFVWMRAKKHEKTIMVYTVNSKYIAKILAKLYPEIWICSDKPTPLLQV